MNKGQRARDALWLSKWEQLGQRINQFPEWMQTILLKDLDTAIRNRITIFEMIQKKVVGA